MGDAPSSSRTRLILPKRTRATLSFDTFAELRAEFGTAPSPTEQPRPPPPPSHTCPFCHESIHAPSSTLTAMLAYWEERKRSGKVLRSTDTLAVCQRHRDERDVIPHGKQRGWPMHIDFHALRRRIMSPSARYMRAIQDVIRDPASSPRFHLARERRKTIGKKASSSAQLDTFHERLSG